MHGCKASKIIRTVVWVAMVACAGVACKVSQQATKKDQTNMKDHTVQGEKIVGALPPLIIYKTRGDYQFLVPVTLNPEKTAVIMFPAPTDLLYEGRLAIPENLDQGYLLDFRGINQNTAFLHITYEKYSQLEKAPTPAELYDLILDKDPFTEIYICGIKEGREADVLKAQELIRTGRLGECVRWTP